MTLLGQAFSTNNSAQFTPSSDPAKAHIQFVNDIPYGSVYASQDLPKDEIPENGYPGQTAYQLIHDELEVIRDFAFATGLILTISCPSIAVARWERQPQLGVVRYHHNGSIRGQINYREFEQERR